VKNLIEQFTNEEGGVWVYPSRPLLVKDVLGWEVVDTGRWKGKLFVNPDYEGYPIAIHSFICTSGRRIDAFNYEKPT
jgi:hypothetical protein